MLKVWAFMPLLIMWLQMVVIPTEAVHHLQYDTDLVRYDEAIPYEDIHLKGMIVPHHSVPVDKLNKMYATVSSDSVEHILLLSPDHFTTSNRPVLTSDLNWQGQFGEVVTDQELYESLSQLDFIFDDDQEIGFEHGITTHIPLIKRYFKNADLLVLAVSKQVSKTSLDRLIAMIPENTLLIASVDFSHYYDLERANAYDAITLEIINSGEYEQFFGMSDAYFDTPGVLYTIFSWMEKNKLKYQVYDQSNSAYYFTRDLLETTSYFFIGFY